MTEREALEQKSFEDLIEIAVAFNLVDREKAASMDSNQLISLIANEEEPSKPEKKTGKKTSSKKTTTSAKTKKDKETTIEKAVTEEAKKEEAPAKKAKKTRSSKSVSEKKEEAENVTSEVPSTEEIKEVKEETAKEEKPSSKKTSKRSSKKSEKEEKTEKVEKAEETPKKKNSGKKKKTEGKTPSDAASEEISAPSGSAEQTSEETKESNSEPEKKQENKNNKRTKGKKRTLSFGPSKEDGTVVVTEVTPSEQEQTEVKNETPEVQEPQYIEVEGVLSIGNSDKGDFNGFVHRNNYLPGEDDAFVQGQLIRRLGLRRGDYIKGLAVAPRGKDKYAPLKRVLSVNGIELSEDTDLDIIRKRKRFESLTAIYPNQKLKLETAFGNSKINDISTRIIDLFSPIGKGQRGMVASPPKAGKTILLQKIANAITANNPDCKLIVLLIDERPEEVTDMQRSVKGEVVYSTFDKRPENHVRVTELVLERAMRLVELGEDVVILLDSMTRLARAYNLTINPTGRTLSGGLDPGSLYGPKRFFGAARNIENGGSLTIIATALIETGSRMDEVIFEEFKGTGNMEITLDRKLADRRVFPAIAVDKSGTRREDLLLTPEELEAMILLRKKLADVDTTTATDAVINFMLKTTNNNSFVLSVKKSFSVDG